MCDPANMHMLRPHALEELPCSNSITPESILMKWVLCLLPFDIVKPTYTGC
jgi:hypothetical protein